MKLFCVFLYLLKNPSSKATTTGPMRMPAGLILNQKKNTYRHTPKSTHSTTSKKGQDKAALQAGQSRKQEKKKSDPFFCRSSQPDPPAVEKFGVFSGGVLVVGDSGGCLFEKWPRGGSPVEGT